MAWPATALAFLFTALFIFLRYTRPEVPEVGVPRTQDLVFTVVFTLFAPVGSVVAARFPRHPIGWICIGVATLTGFNSLAFEYAVYAFYVHPGLPLAGASAWFAMWIWAPPLGMFGLLMLLFPNGKPPSPRWRWVGWTIAGSLVALLAAALPLLADLGPQMLDPEFPESGGLSQRIANVAIPVMFSMVLVAIASLLYRFYRSSGAERQQLKWVGYFGSIIIVLLFMELFGLSLLGMGESSFGGPVAVEIILDVSILGMPLGMAIAILRHRLYDIDRVINRTIVYFVLTIMLVSFYVGLVVSLREVLSSITPSSDLAIVASTLAVAAMFNPVRRHVQAFVDRRFYRRKYDTQMTLDSFSLRLRDEVDMNVLVDDVRDVLKETLQPAHLGLWLRPSKTEP